MQKRKTKPGHYFVPLLGLFMALSCQAQVSRESWINQSSIIFKGEVLLLNTSTIDWPNPDDLAVVSVQEIMSGKVELDAFLKEPITVKFKSLEGLKKGQEIVVYGNKWLTNESIAVTATGYEIIGDNRFNKDNYQREVKQSQITVESRKIREKVSKSDLVIAGTVLSIKKSGLQSKVDSEHYPDWMVADIKIDESFKGSPGGTVTIAFPGSQDVMWFRSPKPKVGQKGIWFLSRENYGFNEVKQLTLTTPDQYREINELDRVRQAIR